LLHQLQSWQRQADYFFSKKQPEGHLDRSMLAMRVNFLSSVENEKNSTHRQVVFVYRLH
jgi:hypothetical protein